MARKNNIYTFDVQKTPSVGAMYRHTKRQRASYSCSSDDEESTSSIVPTYPDPFEAELLPLFRRFDVLIAHGTGRLTLGNTVKVTDQRVLIKAHFTVKT